MSSPAVSIVVVSRGRPQALSRCLTGIAQLSYSPFEVVVVADRAGLHRLGNRPDLFGRIKQVRCDRPNISTARNLGLAQAAGEVVAFLDDDAVPEPLWLSHLAAPFVDPDVSAATGFVRGRDGISYQWTAREIDRAGRAHPLETGGMAPFLLEPGNGRGVKAEGTNMALRRSVLDEVGGFDESYRFYMDETDLSLRLALAGHATAVVPRAQVHHGFFASDRRREDAVPRDLAEVGASLAIFLRRHAGGQDPGKLRRAEKMDRRAALLRHMVAGRIEPRDIRRILSTFDAGFREGRTRDLPDIAAPSAPEAEFLPFRPTTPPQPHVLVAGRVWQTRRRWARAVALARQGHRVSLFLFSPDARRHRVRFDPAGIWVQRGGLFGRSGAERPPDWHFTARVRQEARRVEQFRSPAAWPGNTSR